MTTLQTVLLRDKGSTHKWITSWLSERYQKVVLDGQASDQVPVLTGVPQGSVLGPVLLSSPEPKAHRAYRMPMVRRPSVVRPSSVRQQFSKFFFSETASPIKADFYRKPL